MGDAALGSPWTLVDGDREVASVPRGAFLRFTMLNHWYHHRGQLTVYLRELGVAVPAIYGDSADEKLIPA
ncbi:MAG: DinB family protein [Gemmatimonadota bacterium]|nr:DinB family protein [Gemmatimonadota bacterium]